MLETAFILFIKFNDKFEVKIPYPTIEQCNKAVMLIDEDPNYLWYNPKGIEKIEYRCINLNE